MRAVLVDPHKKIVTALFDEFDSQRTDELIRHHIGSTQIRRTPLDGVNVMFHDEVGLARVGQAYWGIKGQPAIIAGKGLVLSMRPDGLLKTSTVIISVLEPLLEWKTPEEAVALYSDYDKFQCLATQRIDRQGEPITLQ